MSSEPADAAVHAPRADESQHAHSRGPATLALELGSHAHSFRVGSGPAVDIGRRRVLRALLRALVHAHVRTPRRSLSTEELVQEVWPGDRSPHASARNRLYFAINALRELGLRDLIVREGGGYALTEHVVIATR